MTTTINALDIKDHILTILAKVKDEQKLLEILDFVAHSVTDSEQEMGKDWSKEFSAEQIADLEQGLEEIRDPANRVSHTEALKMFEKWKSNL